MIHEAPNVQATGPGGFVGIEQAEQLRQKVTSDEFREKYPAEYERAVSAAVALKLAEQESKAARAAIASLSTPVKTGDLIDAVERDARERLSGRKSPGAHSSVNSISAPDGVDVKSGKKARLVSTKDIDGATKIGFSSETVPELS